MWSFILTSYKALNMNNNECLLLFINLNNNFIIIYYV